MFQNKKNKRKPVMFDIKPIKYSGDFSFSKNDEKLRKNSQIEHESFLIEALKVEEESESLKIKERKIVQKNRELEIKKEACSFNNINFNRNFAKEEVPVKIISEKFSKKYFEKKQQEKNENEFLLREQREEAKKKILIEKINYRNEIKEKERLELEEESFAKIIQEERQPYLVYW